MPETILQKNRVLLVRRKSTSPTVGKHQAGLQPINIIAQSVVYCIQ